uniref:hypothetical protein n=1 Tax=Paracoccus aeridis TaxID=1966466 RepID=UPI003F698490
VATSEEVGAYAGRLRWAKVNLGPGDLVHARGTIRETSYEKDGETRYGVTLAAEQFDLLCPKDRQ